LESDAEIALENLRRLIAQILHELNPLTRPSVLVLATVKRSHYHWKD
jgi:hypothetical protein